MQITIIAVGTKMPDWVNKPCLDYMRRMPRDCQVKLLEIPLERRSSNQSVEKTRERESLKILNAVPSANRIIALDERGEMFDTKGLSKKIAAWQLEGSNISLIIGGPDGLDQSVLDKAHSNWSLSKLTLPHPMVRILLTEQLYRACSLMNGHPYHRDCR